MKQEAFVARHQAEWDAFERWLDARGESLHRARRERELPDLRDADVPARYSPALTARLQVLMQRGHAVLYRTPPPRWHRLLVFLVAGFPRLVRAERGCMIAAALLLYLPAVLAFAAIQWQPDLSASMFSPEQLAQFEQMYDPADPQRRLGRDDGTDVAMFGHYVWNNISIGFRTFASGLLANVRKPMEMLFQT